LRNRGYEDDELVTPTMCARPTELEGLKGIAIVGLAGAERRIDSMEK